MLIKDLGHHNFSLTNSESAAIPHSIFLIYLLKLKYQTHISMR